MSISFSYFIHNIEKLKKEWNLLEEEENKSIGQDSLIELLEQIDNCVNMKDFQGFLKKYDNLIYIITIRLVKKNRNEKAIDLIKQSSFLVNEGLVEDKTSLGNSYYSISKIFCDVVTPIHLNSYYEGIIFLEKSILIFQEIKREKNVRDFSQLLKTYKQVYRDTLLEQINPVILDLLSKENIKNLTFKNIKIKISSELDIKSEELSNELLLESIFNFPKLQIMKDNFLLDNKQYRTIISLYKDILSNFIHKITSYELISLTFKSLNFILLILLKTKIIPFEERLDDNIYFHDWIIKNPKAENFPIILVSSLKSLSEIFKFKGDITKSNYYLYKSLTYEISSPFTLSSINFSIIHNHVLEKEYLKALDQYGKYVSLFSTNDNNIIKSQLEFANALILTAKKDSRSRIKAEDVIKNLVEKNMLQSDHRSLAIKHLVELRLTELEIYGDPEILIEIMGYIDFFEKQAEEDEEITQRIEALILKGKINSIKGELALTKSQYEKASKLAGQHGLGLLFKEVEIERKRLEERYEEWERIIIENPSFVEKIKRMQVMEYMKKAQRMMVDIDG
ncbi:MAG: hypothetical protein GPJ54_17090 [Candidatus Heimdallarchaeota archaeon]|nr:hypothetical protein [Candidatus Heimdallarchaeota archaeon]